MVIGFLIKRDDPMVCCATKDAAISECLRDGAEAAFSAEIV